MKALQEYHLARRACIFGLVEGFLSRRGYLLTL